MFPHGKHCMRSRGNKSHCFVIPLNSKLEKKKLGRNRLLYSGWLTNLQRFQEARPDHVRRVESSCCCFPREFSEFCLP